MGRTYDVASAAGQTLEIGFWRVGCQRLHFVRVRGSPAWAWNGDRERPTFNPSVLVDGTDPQRRCHFYVKHGRLAYCSDCHHALAGQTVDMVDVPDNRY